MKVRPRTAPEIERDRTVATLIEAVVGILIFLFFLWLLGEATGTQGAQTGQETVLLAPQKDQKEEEKPKMTKCPYCGTEYEIPKAYQDDEGNLAPWAQYATGHRPQTFESEEMKITTCEVAYTRAMLNLLSGASVVEVKEKR
jgi:hypothetical protein